MKTRILVVNSIPETEAMNEKAVNLVREFNQSGRKLILEVFENYTGRTLEDILEEGMYFYLCSDPDILEMLEADRVFYGQYSV